MNKLPEALYQNTAWDQEKNPIWMGSTLHLYRNFSLYKFPGKMTPAEMSGSLKTVFETIQKLPSLQPLVLFPAETLTPLDKELLFEHFQCSKGFQEMHEGHGFAFNTERRYLITINESNHLQIHQASQENDLVSAWTSLAAIDDAIGREHPYAFLPRFGFLTADPMLCGTALEARIFLHVPALHHTGKLKDLLTELSDEQISFEGLEGSTEDLIGDFLVLKNHYTLGISEETTLSLLQSTAQKIVAAENKLRDEQKTKATDALKDFVGRSFGLIMHSYQLHPKEALSGLSGLKLGVLLGWISGTTSQKLSILMLKLRRGYLAHLLNLQTSDTQELSHKRAEWLHQELKGTTITE
ncbi:MAG: hypothetical protein KBA81_04315 [Rhabdochlamydiaceae bacterium]|nr:hypothetical protein [Rhabdochlamydiaceae bacterium]